MNHRQAGSNPVIAALATPPGHGGVGIIRISGGDLTPLFQGLLGFEPEPRHAHFARFQDAVGQTIDKGIALFFPAPHSYTGENILELQGHGGPVVMDMLLQRTLALGAQLAQPGEFTERAFLNNKLDLAQAEAVADIINSTTEQAVRSAQKSLQGDFSRTIEDMVAQLTELRIYTEASIDFVDEDIDFLSSGDISNRVQGIDHQLAVILQTARQGRLLRDGMTLVIAGRPNAGKSSLLNRLAGHDAAIVSDQAGTTRDVLREHIQLDGIPLHIFDTAGLHHSDNPVEQEGIRRAREALQQADRILLVMDATRPETEPEELLGFIPEGIGITRIHNKIDLSGDPAGIQLDEASGRCDIYLSAHASDGLELLKQHLKQCCGYDDSTSDVFTARRRHLDALQQAREHIAQGLALLQHDPQLEIIAEELRLAQDALQTITGEFSADDLLGEIFSSFCIGK